MKNILFEFKELEGGKLQLSVADDDRANAFVRALPLLGFALEWRREALEIVGSICRLREVRRLGDAW